MAKEVVLDAEARPDSGSRIAGRIRREGKVPAVIYGHGIAPKSIAVDARALRGALHTEAGLNALINLKVGKESHLALAREPQRDPVRGTIQHVDFLVVNRDEEVTAEVPITLIGEAEGVKRGGGVLEHHIFTLPVKATPDKIPSHVELDISEMNVGDSLRVSDIKLPTGVTTGMEAEEMVVMVDIPRVVAEPEPEVTEEAVEEGAEGAEPTSETSASETPAPES